MRNGPHIVDEILIAKIEFNTEWVILLGIGTHFSVFIKENRFLKIKLDFLSRLFGNNVYGNQINTLFFLFCVKIDQILNFVTCTISGELHFTKNTEWNNVLSGSTCRPYFSVDWIIFENFLKIFCKLRNMTV